MNPVLFHFGWFELRWYGLMIAIAFLTGIWMAKKEARRKGINLEHIERFAVWAMIFSIMGARIYYILFSDPGLFLKNPISAFAIWEGGMAIHGGILGGLIAVIIYTIKYQIPFWLFADTLAPSLILGQAIGRIGCFFNGDAHGLPTSLPWGMIYSPESPAGQMFPGQPLHPTQLYAMGLNFMIFFFLWSCRKNIKTHGNLFLLYVILYSVGRFLVENIRADQLTYMGGISTAQTISMTGVITAVSLMVYRNRSTGPKNNKSRHNAKIL